jgi:hypothetical protein
MTKLPQVSQIVYNQSKLGFYGELGEGANAKVRFLQTVITGQELENITLISNIPGSEAWDVRDLFQRDVDDERVTKEILPYFKDPTLVKYFNPITLILLPMSDNGNEVIKDVEFISPEIGTDGIKEYYEKTDYYKFSIYDHSEAIGKIEWNTKKCFLVAIDGQHRVSALKRWKKEPSGQFNDWKIPVTILNIFKVDPSANTASLLEIVRKTFVYINSKSEKINFAREILLNDESVNYICTQELVQYTHENDILPFAQRNQSILPLMFFDWQGKVYDNKGVEAPVSIMSIEEINFWFEEYLLGEDGSLDQKNELELVDLVPPLDSFGKDVALSHEDAHRVRSQFRQVMLPGLLHLIQNFSPYKNYITGCRSIEEDAIRRSDNAQHAFMKLRFGSYNAPPDQRYSVEAECDNLKAKFQDLKKNIPSLIRMDVGMRGIIYTFGQSKLEFQSIKETVTSWLDYSKVYITEVNKIYEEGWFVHYDDLNIDKKKILTYLVYDDAGGIINYKISQAKDGLGPLLLILVFKKLLNAGLIDDDDFTYIWGEYANTLRKAYEKGLRKHYKSILQQTWEGSIAEFNAEVKKRAEVDSNIRVDYFEKYIQRNE